MNAIYYALRYFVNSEFKNADILHDSMSSLKILQYDSRNKTAMNIRNLIKNSPKRVNFFWVKAHIGT